MPVVKRKPTSPGRRFVVGVVNPELHKSKGFSPLLAPKKTHRRSQLQWAYHDQAHWRWSQTALQDHRLQKKQG